MKKNLNNLKIIPQKTWIYINDKGKKISSSNIKNRLYKNRQINNLTKKILDIVYQILDDNKAQNIVIIDLKNKSSIADYMIIASGTSSRHIQAISENTAQKLRSFGLDDCRIEGQDSDDWKLIDALEIVIHIFHPEKRSSYNLEKMWEDILPKQQITI